MVTPAGGSAGGGARPGEAAEHDVVCGACAGVAHLEVVGEAAMRSLGATLAASLPPRAVVTLSGELGAGKSVLARSMLRAFGQTGAVPSPTYAIVESYALARRHVAHLDLYRLLDPGELHDIGFDEVLAAHDTLLIEWPERGDGWLPAADVAVRIEHAGEGGRRVTVHRAACRARGPEGAATDRLPPDPPPDPPPEPLDNGKRSPML